MALELFDILGSAAFWVAVLLRAGTGLGMTESSPFAIFITGPDVQSGHLGLPTPGGTVVLLDELVATAQHEDEILSVLLEVDGAPREKRPYTGEMVHFAPLGAGSYRVRVTARAPGEPARDLAEASLELKT